MVYPQKYSISQCGVDLTVMYLNNTRMYWYEILINGQQTFGLKELKHLLCLSKGQPLSRIVPLKKLA